VKKAFDFKTLARFYFRRVYSICQVSVSIAKDEVSLFFEMDVFSPEIS
jgi:hypothetical protein